MTRPTTALCAAAALGLAATLGAQGTTTTTTEQHPTKDMGAGREVIVTGCLSKGADGNYILTAARMEPATRATGTTGTVTSSATTSATEPSGSGTMSRPMTWSLSGGGDLDKHVGRKIQVTGRTSWGGASDRRSPPDPAATTPTDGSTPASETQPKQPEIDVQAVSLIATSCS